MPAGLFPFRLPKVSKREFDMLIENGKVLSRDDHGDKVIHLSDGNVMKLFRRKRFLSSNLIVPYAVRFERACAKLQAADVRTVKVLRVARVPHIKRDVVIYEFLAGESLREQLEDTCSPTEAKKLWDRFLQYLDSLHDRGIFMHGMHLGNIVVDEENNFGLVDVVDVTVRKRMICSMERQHNRDSIKTKDGALLRLLNLRIEE